MPKDTTTHLVVAQGTLEGGPVLNPDNPMLAKTVTLTAELAPKRREKALPQMRRLRNILGDAVLEIIPEGLREAVDGVYVWGQTNPDTFQVTQFDTAEEVQGTLELMRAYAEMAWDYGYTIYTKDDIDPAKLIWKVTDRRGSKSARLDGREDETGVS
jgi:hypothetical protein